MEGRGAGEDEALVDTFCGITSSTREEALFFLESHNWILDSAILSFYENNNEQEHDQLGQGVGGAGEEEPIVPPQASELPPSHPSPFPVARSVQSAATMTSSDRNPSRSSGGRPGIRTLADLNRQSGPGSDSDSDGPQEYYTGGEKSGMLVQDPSKGPHDVDSIFEQARQMGALQGPFEHHPSSSSRSFTGTGRLLSGETVPSASQQPENVIHNIYFWSNGFTVNDGPLRRFDDPENASFLESIRKSECPKELEPADKRSMVHVNLMRREENCPEPVKCRSPFQGQGRTLGGGSTGSLASEPAAASTTATASTTTNVSSPSAFDDSLPSTSIQLRLADGSRMVARFNTHQTVGDIRAFIDRAISGHGATGMPYTLQTVGFPPKQLTDATQTIEQAGLANSVVIQKL